MRYLVAIEPGNRDTAYGVIVPDLPGCFSAGDTFEEALENAEEAILLHLEGLIEEGRDIPEQQSAETHLGNPAWQNYTWAFVDIDLSELQGPAKRVNVTIPQRVLRIIDTAAKQSGESRSGFISRSALSAARRKADKHGST